jgi:hypothetical protein
LFSLITQPEYRSFHHIILRGGKLYKPNLMIVSQSAGDGLFWATLPEREG